MDKHRRPLEFQPDDWVLLRFSKARLRQRTCKGGQGEPIGHQNFYAKLAKRYYGPFQILERMNDVRAIPRDVRVIPKAEGDTLGHFVLLKGMLGLC